MRPRQSNTRPRLAGAALLVVALAVELVDELVDGTKGAAFPLIRHDLALSYGQVGLLASAPLVLGGLLEAPIGLLAGHGRRRYRAILAGGVMFVAALIGAAAARSFATLLIAFVAFFPASGAFVGLTQSGLMDSDPGRQEQHMARWTLAGSVGAVSGPIVLVAVLAAGGTWRAAYLLLAAFAAVAWLGAVRAGPRGEQPSAAGGSGPSSKTAAARRALSALRQREVVRWIVFLEVCDLLLDVLTGFLALYFVDVVHATPAQAALGVAVRVGAGLAGDVVLIWVLDRVGGLRVLRASAAAAAVLYPAFLLVPAMVPKLLLLAVLSAATAPWYPVTTAQLYRSLPGQSDVAVSLTSVAGLAGGLGPLVVGFLAQRVGLAFALACLTVAPISLLCGMGRRRKAD